jgi:hypothetical protein
MTADLFLTLGVLTAVFVALLMGFLSADAAMPGEEKGIRRLLLRMCPSVTVYSAFLNDTPVVTMGIPVILGGICILIGPSTSLVVHGLLPVLMWIVVLVAAPLVWPISPAARRRPPSQLLHLDASLLRPRRRG